MALAAPAAVSAGGTATALRASVKPASRLNSPPPHPSPSPSPVVGPTEPQAQPAPAVTRRQASSLLLFPILLPLSSTSAALLGSGLAGGPADTTAMAAEEGKRGPAFQEVEGGVKVLDVRVGTGAAPEMGQRVRRGEEGRGEVGERGVKGLRTGREGVHCVG